MTKQDLEGLNILEAVFHLKAPNKNIFINEGPNFPGSDLPGPNLPRQHFPGAQFAKARFAVAQFAVAQFGGVKFAKNGKLGPKMAN